MPKYYKKENVLFFIKEELYNLIKIQKIPELRKIILENNITLNDIKNNTLKAEKAVDPMSKKMAKDRDEHEIGIALLSMPDFFKGETEICFKMKIGFNPDKDKFDTLETLNKLRAVDDDSDFMLYNDNKLMAFQLKRYFDKLDTENIYVFIKNVMIHYCNNLGQTNLIILPQAKPYTTFDLDFNKLHADIKSLGLKSKGEIYFKYNDMNKNNVIIRLYPKLSKMSVPFIMPSDKF